ncbi:GL20864 [Drosophila persimilis]|uniref:GL20864 n=1 Tax=Drosophila persimilis TaxID=7234 RepID=B4H4E7_DROPE|nr:GL20864 [Drosophila persimilis]
MAMAMSPVRDAAAHTRCDLNGNPTSAGATNTTSATSSTSSPRKTKKTIINWLVNGSRAATATATPTASASVSASDSDNNNRQSVRDNASLDDYQNQNQNQNQNQSCNCESRAFRDFRGVQTLRLLWSRRIKSASEDHTGAPSSRASSLGTLRMLNKSVSCLVNAFNNPSPEKSLAKRAASLHNLQDATAQQQQLQREKDNFYKYKNAEQARMRSKLRPSSDEAVINANKIPTANATKNASATLVASKCDDSVPPLPPAATECNMESPSPRRLSDNVISSMELEVGAEQEEEEEEVELRATPARSRARARVRVSLSAASAQSGGSSESEHTTSTQTSSTVTSSGTRTVTKRKYSFKTHAGRSYVQHHTPRRINSSCLAGMGQATDAPPQQQQQRQHQARTAWVAKLTQQMPRVLEEVKRKKGVWLARGSHVYKIVEKQPPVMQQQQQQLPPESGISTVQRNIKKFETLEKPSVPQKSEQLRRRHLELVAATAQARGSNSLTLKTKRSLKGSPAELEVVCEEAKTPVEAEPAAEEEATKEDQPTAGQQQDVAMDDDLKPDLEMDEERQKQRKHKYASIYEKLRFTFAGRARKSASPSPTKNAPEMVPEMIPEMEIKQKEELEPELDADPYPGGQEASSPQMMVPCIEADADSKILDALEVLDQKLKEISAHSESGELLLGTNDDFEQRLLPNTSFVYQAANKQISNNQLLVNQAVNVTLVNAIEGEQMIMEQKQLMNAERENQKGTVKEEQVAPKEDDTQTDEPKQVPEEEEPESIYEPITPSGMSAIEPKTEAQASGLFKIADIQKSEIIEDIYQTVEEASATASCPRPNTWLEDYESIAGSCEAAAPDFDGYESFAPPPPKPAANAEDALPMATPSPGAHGGTLGRNTRDELPELPKPKRVLPKSPTPLRPAPPKPNHASTLDLGKDEDEDENIYDTIKGCYESMHTKAPASNSNSSGSGSGGTTTTDAISLGSNCYESISHYRKAKTTATGHGHGHGPGGTCIQLSSSGSTLTISSDHKTNSLYESSLAAAGCVIYGSASVGCRSSLGSGGSASSGGGAKRSGDKRSSIAGSSDNSDAWVDISDGEGASASPADRLEARPPTEAQFVVVRERLKPHRTRSPDWSKRIRDKRLQQKKAISCIEVILDVCNVQEEAFLISINSRVD